MYRFERDSSPSPVDSSSSSSTDEAKRLFPRSILKSSHKSNRSSSSARKSWKYHLYSIWLFTRSDLKTIIVPKTTFGILNATAAAAFLINPAPDPTRILVRLPLVLFWTWTNLLPFAIDNQRQPGSLIEDRANKPWRTIPSGRMTPAQAKRIMFPLYAVAAVYSLCLGGWRQSVALMALGCWYNDLGGADASWISRNFINAVGFACYATGAMEVALGTAVPLLGPLGAWAALLAAVVFTTVHTQDMYDQEGDGLRGRITLPLAVGDAPARYVTAFWMLVWVGVCPWFWGLSFLPRIAYAALGTTVVTRTLRKRTVPEDRQTFRLWNLWMVFTYTLPLLSLLRTKHLEL
jgi:4-hydroxybenzoate polyprenyltransferase